MKDDFKYIQNCYGVPAQEEQRVEYTPTNGLPKQGRIIGAEGHYIRIHFDGEKKPYPGLFHPTWSIKYL